MLVFTTLAKLGAGVLAVGTTTAIVAPVALSSTTPRTKEFIEYQSKGDYERLCREVGQELTVISDSDSEEDEKIKLLACPVKENSDQTTFYLFNLKDIPTKEVEKLSFSKDDSFAKVEFTLSSLGSTNEIYRAHSTVWETYNGINLKEVCQVSWGNPEQKESKEMTCNQKQKEWLKVINNTDDLSWQA